MQVQRWFALNVLDGQVKGAVEPRVRHGIGAILQGRHDQGRCEMAEIDGNAIIHLTHGVVPKAVDFALQKRCENPRRPTGGNPAGGRCHDRAGRCEFGPRV